MGALPRRGGQVLDQGAHVGTLGAGGAGFLDGVHERGEVLEQFLRVK